MPKYCKAYKYEDVKKFPGWADGLAEGTDLNDGDIVYILEDGRVTTNPLDFDDASGHIFTTVTPEWQTFIKDQLSFAVPDWEETEA